MSRKAFEKYNTEAFLEKDWVLPFSEVPAGSKIILYGAGDVGQAYYEQIKATNYCQIKKWVDKQYKLYQEYGMPVEAAEGLKEIEADYVIIAAAQKSIACEVLDFLRSSGFDSEQIIWGPAIRNTLHGSVINERLIKPGEDKLRELCSRKGICSERGNIKDLSALIQNAASGEALVIPRLVLQVTTCCTLKCEGCNNLIPCIKKPEHERLSDVLSDLEKVLNGVDRILVLEILGGEPFLYPELAEVIKYSVNHPKVLEVEITTNGTIIPKDEQLDIMTHSKLRVIISNYEHKNQSELEEKLLNRGVRYEVRDYEYWIDSGGTEKRSKTPLKLKQDFLSCHAGLECKTLYRGKLYHCPRSASLNLLGICSGDYLDVRNSEFSRQSLKKFWIGTDCMACDYCDYSEEWRLIPYPKV